MATLPDRIRLPHEKDNTLSVEGGINTNLVDLIVGGAREYVEEFSKGLLEDGGPFPYRGKTYTPHEVVECMKEAWAAYSTGVASLLKGVRSEKVRVGIYFMRRMHRALRHNLFAVSLDNYYDGRVRRKYPDPTKMSVKKCLEYAKEHGSTVNQPISDGRPDHLHTGRTRAADILAGSDQGLRELRLITRCSLETAYTCRDPYLRDYFRNPKGRQFNFQISNPTP